MAKSVVNKDVIEERIDALKQKITKLEKDLEGKVSEKPKEALAISFGAGVLAGALALSLLRRKR